MGRLEKAKNLEHRRRLIFRLLRKAPFVTVFVVILLYTLDRSTRQRGPRTDEMQGVRRLHADLSTAEMAGVERRERHPVDPSLIRGQ